MMCSWVDVLCFADFLVGGQWRSDLEDGLFASSWSATSGLTTTDIGARLLIRDLMCFVPVCSSSYLLVSLLLSAVIGTTLPRLACGIGISITLPLICGLPSVLDYLICSLGTWCVWVLACYELCSCRRYVLGHLDLWLVVLGFRPYFVLCLFRYRCSTYYMGIDV